MTHNHLRGLSNEALLAQLNALSSETEARRQEAVQFLESLKLFEERNAYIQPNITITASKNKQSKRTVHIVRKPRPPKLEEPREFQKQSKPCPKKFQRTRLFNRSVEEATQFSSMAIETARQHVYCEKYNLYPEQVSDERLRQRAQRFGLHTPSLCEKSNG
jgi:hypothetical protein